MGLDEETVGVVVPMYNSECTIAATLASICAQTHRRLDVVVTDDGSTDGSAAIVEGWCRHDPRGGRRRRCLWRTRRITRGSRRHQPSTIAAEPSVEPSSVTTMSSRRWVWAQMLATLPRSAFRIVHRHDDAHRLLVRAHRPPASARHPVGWCRQSSLSGSCSGSSIRLHHRPGHRAEANLAFARGVMPMCACWERGSHRR